MKRPLQRFAAVAVLSSLVACAGGTDARPGAVAPPGHLVAGVQIWNGTKAPLKCRAALVGDGGERVELAKDLVVPEPARVTDASLGGDPNAVREATGSVPPGTWTFVVEAGGHTARLTASWPDASWAIAFVGPDGIRILGDSAPRRLE
jgi:hypothetical protein